MREQLIDQGNQLEELLADDFVYIRQDGNQMDKEAISLKKRLNSAIKDIQITSISQKTKLICYELDGIVHTSIWRRHELGKISFIKKLKRRQTMTLSNGWGLFDYSYFKQKTDYDGLEDFAFRACFASFLA